MKKQIISLDGLWDLCGTDPDGSKSINLKGHIPGHVHNDLFREGHINDLFWRDQAEECQWVEDWTWTYRREFKIDEIFNIDWVEIDFEGIDTYAEIYLNRKYLGCTRNMFVPHKFNAGEFLIYGNNSIEVVITPWKVNIQRKEKYPAAFDGMRVHVRRMQCTFGWDWVNRFVSAGIWRSVNIYSYEHAYIKDVFIYTKTIYDDMAALEITLETVFRNTEYVWADISIKGPGGQIVWNENRRIWQPCLFIQADICNPELWWPAGVGKQSLYECSVAIYDDSGVEIDENTVKFGIRTVHIEQKKDLLGSLEYDKTLKFRKMRELTNSKHEKDGNNPGSSFIVLINNKKIFCKGGNWVPADPFPSRINNEWYDRLIWLAREGNHNFLRCWGGGIYEPEAFWNACDKYGIMISQDFTMACAKYPYDDREFVDMIAEEIPKAVRLLRNHPSLVFWSGDNENSMSYDFDDPKGWSYKLGDDIILPCIRKMDPSRQFFYTSPYGGHTNLTVTIGDTHFSALFDGNYATETDMNDYMERVKIVGRYMSESTTMGAPTFTSLLKFMTEDDIANPEKKMWEYHTKSPGKQYTLFMTLETITEKLFGQAGNITDKVKHMQYLQYEHIRISMESARRNKWYCSGLLYWMYNDCWPASGWSIVDYYTFPKAGWYSFKRAGKPIIASIEKEADSYRFWVCNDETTDVCGQMNIYVQPWYGSALFNKTFTFIVNSNSSEVIIEIPVNEINVFLNNDSVLVCDINSNFFKDRAFYFNGMPYEMNIPPTDIEIDIYGVEMQGTVKIKTMDYARVVTLEGDIYFEDNYFDMMPGEERIIKWYSPEGNGKDIKVSCWNQLDK